jgi:Holliday junction resolvase
MEKGSKSNKTGNQLERTVVSVFSEKGFEVAKYRDWKKKLRKIRKRVVTGECSIYYNL